MVSPTDPPNTSGPRKPPLRNLSKEPDASDPELVEQRLRQWRRASRNPFEPTSKGSMNSTVPTKSETDTNNAADTIKELPYDRRPAPDRSKSAQTQESAVKGSGFSQVHEDEHPELKHPGSQWVHLFYDLVWSASFASLTENGKFENPLDSLSYFLFFAAVLWLWASQTLYSIHFYTNDWFHLTSTFLQLFIFGMLSATTQGYDVTTYIAHSPGFPTFREKKDGEDIEPQEHADEKVAYLSMLVLAIALVATRIIHLVQYLRVLYYASWATKPGDKKSGNEDQISSQSAAQTGINQSGVDAQIPDRPWIRVIPPQLKAITIGLLLSNPMFIAALVITASDFGKTVLGASLKLGLWIGGFLVEVFSHLTMPTYWWLTQSKNSTNTSESADREKGPLDMLKYSETLGIKLPVATGMSLYERLQTITTIIFGEGINGIAGTLSAVLVAPGVGQTVAINVASAACTVWFIAYIYFEGPKGETTPKLTSLRYLLWLILHLPFLASTVLLLIGMKSQFLLTSFLSALFSTTSGFNRIIDEQLLGNSNATVWRTNADMKQFLLDHGIVWKDEFDNLINATRNASVAERPNVMPVWSQRLSLTMVLNTFKEINGGDDSIPNDIQPNITDYYKNFAQVVEDIGNTTTNPAGTAYYRILSALLDGYVLSTRYIIAFAGLILISLSLQDFIHSWPRDRYQWGVIASRFLMGIVLSSLLLLNLGKYQELFVPFDQANQRAGVFLWLEAFWVLPTIAIAYGLEFLTEIALARFAKRATQKTTAVTQTAMGSTQMTMSPTQIGVELTQNREGTSDKLNKEKDKLL